MNRLKKRWNISINWQLASILIVFAITGFSSLQLAKPFLSLIGIPENFEPHWLYRILRLVLIFPIYQVLLIFIGFIFGQFSFFWNFEKKMLNKMKLGFLVNFVEEKILKK